MRIIEEGIPEWIDRIVLCPHCKTKMQLEAGDDVRMCYNGMWCAYMVVCPSCFQLFNLIMDFDSVPDDIDERDEDEIAEIKIGKDGKELPSDRAVVLSSAFAEVIKHMESVRNEGKKEGS